MCIFIWDGYRNGRDGRGRRGNPDGAGEAAPSPRVLDNVRVAEATSAAVGLVDVAMLSRKGRKQQKGRDRHIEVQKSGLLNF